MLGRVSSNPNVLDQLSEATISKATIPRQLWFMDKGRPLKHPILNDRFTEGNQVGVYPRSAHVLVIQFQIIFIFAHV